ncbi:MAG TPA: RagB/SusD family nutrient uptake outer membrane protein [Chitinophaga sp.]
MKNLKLYIPLVALLAFTACKKSFLDTEDVTSATEQNFYKTPDDAYKALVGVYDGMQRLYAGGFALPVAAEVMSDDLFGGGGASDGLGLQMIDEFDKLRSPSDQALYGDNWSNYYKAIYRANMLLTHLDQVNWKGKESLRNIYEAETRFIRAYCYFDMVRLCGNVPLLTKPTTDNVPQTPADIVYNLIATDLQFAATNLPATGYGAQDPSTHGRVTKWAAESSLGRVFLY